MKGFVSLLLLVGVGVGVYIYLQEDASKSIKAEMARLIDDMEINPEWREEASVLFTACHEKAFEAALDVTQRLGKKFDSDTYYNKVLEMMQERAREDGNTLLADKLEEQKPLHTLKVTER